MVDLAPLDFAPLAFSSLMDFSHTHCVAICAVLVPLNLLATLVTMILTGLNQPVVYRWLAIALASLCAGMMVLHVLTWFVIGVVMAQTYILLALGSVCLLINLWASIHSYSLQTWITRLVQVVTPMVLSLSPAGLNSRHD